MKQDINLGTVVDDGTGDYLRQGGVKINANFQEVYDDLGDGTFVHPAGAWKVHSRAVDGATLTVKFGDAYVIDTNGGTVDVTFPKGTAADYGKVIKLRDANGTWGQQACRIVVQTGDNIKGETGTVGFTRQYQDLELTYTSPSRFEYAPQKLVTGISFGSTPSVLRSAWIATADERDFDVFAKINGEYNKAAFEVYRRGNMLYYGDEGLNDLSDYGSVPPAATAWATATVYTINTVITEGTDWYIAIGDHTASATFAEDAAFWTKQNNGDLYPLDGRTIRLRLPAKENDPIAAVTYLTDVSSFRTSYNKNSILLVDNSDNSMVASAGQVVKMDFATDKTLSLVDFGYPAHTQFNPESVEISLNGSELIKARSAGTGYEDNGDFDFDPQQDVDDLWNTIVFDVVLQPGDVVTVRWFDSVIGTLLSYDEGDDSIQTRSDSRYLQTLYTFNRSNKIRYTDTDAPSSPSAEVVPEVETDIRWDEVTSLLESIYPVGSLYFNATNPNNPRDYMGFGKWVRYGEGKTFVGWQDANDQGQYDADFGLNNQWLDGSSQPTPAAGGTGGSKSVMLVSANIPELKSGLDDTGSRDSNDPTEQYALVARPADGALNLNGCQPDPDDTSPALGTYAEEPITVNAGQVTTGVSILQPFITIHSWVRTE